MALTAVVLTAIVLTGCGKAEDKEAGARAPRQQSTTQSKFLDHGMLTEFLEAASDQDVAGYSIVDGAASEALTKVIQKEPSPRSNIALGLPKEIDDVIRAGKRWTEVPWNTWTYLNCNGDAQYIYPGPDGDFWSSVRMEVIRDSFEDHDYLALLREARGILAAANLPGTQALLADADALLTIGPPLISDLTVATDDHMALVQRRDAIAELLEHILESLGSKRVAK